MKKGRNIFLIGPMGAGKSTIGRLIAQELAWDFYDSDQEIEKRCGADIAWIFDIEGEEGFRQREIKVIEELTQYSSIVLSTGGGAIISEENRHFLSARGIVLYLKTTLETQYDRTRHDAKRPLLHTENVYQRLKDLWAERAPLYEEIADFSFDTDGHTVKYIASHIVKTLYDERLL